MNIKLSSVYDKDWLMNRGLVWNGRPMPYNPDLKERAKELRKNMTKAERKLWYEFLQPLRLSFYRQRPIDHYIVDFYNSESRLVIEIDGSQHYTAEGIVNDLIRTEVLELYGLKVLRFSNREVVNEFLSVCQKIEDIVKGPINATPQSVFDCQLPC